MTAVLYYVQVGNTGPVQEFNMQVDPEAAKIMFEAGMVWQLPGRLRVQATTCRKHHGHSCVR